MRPAWFFRMTLWARRPPSEKRIKLVAAILFLIAIVAVLEWYGLWPDALTARPLRP